MLNRAGRKVTRLADAEAAVFHGGKPLEQSHYKVHAKEVTSGAEYMAFFAVDAAVKAHATAFIRLVLDQSDLLPRGVPLSRQQHAQPIPRGRIAALTRCRPSSSAGPDTCHSVPARILAKIRGHTCRRV